MSVFQKNKILGVTPILEKVPMATIYIHWPFCLSKCSYCDFNSFALPQCIDYDQWLFYYKKVLSEFAKYNKPITSLYFGGGTPSLLPVTFIGSIVSFVQDNFDVVAEAEITLEINPGSFSEQPFRVAGINRVSIGIQSIYESGLRILGRTSHNVTDAFRCIDHLSESFNNISIDLIYNRPYQTPKAWSIELTDIVERYEEKITHMSCYELIVESETDLARKISLGVLPKPLETDEFFDITHEILCGCGFEMYEVSNYAKPEFHSKHNMSYWKYEDYYGIGPGAHSRITQDGTFAIAQEKEPSKWMNWAKSFQGLPLQKLSNDEVLEEKVIMGLRAKCGVNEVVLTQIANYEKKLSCLVDNSYIVFSNGVYTATYEGVKRLNLIIEYIFR
jgi:oxygen-independent coproporphyrinogen-3 oxidase